MIGDLLDHSAMLKNLHHTIRMAADGLRQLLLHEWTLGIPPQHYLILCSIPHHGQRIELAVERTLFVDTAGIALALKGRARKTFPLCIRDDGDLAAVTIREGFRLQTVIDGLRNFLACKVRPKRAIDIGEPAADVTSKTDAAGH